MLELLQKTRITSIVRTGSLVAVSVGIAIGAVSPAVAQREFPGEGGGGRPPRGGDGEGPGPRPHVIQPIQPIVIPTPPAPTPPPPPTPSQTNPFANPTPVQTDFQSGLGSFPGNAPATPAIYHEAAMGGVILLPKTEFPKEEATNGPISGITVKWTEGTQFDKVSEFIVKLDDGEILVSVKRPSKLALIKTPLGKVAVNSNGDVLAKFHNGVLRVTNLDGTGKAIKALFDRKGIFDTPIAVSLKAGSELVCGEKKLSRRDIRPKDGLARRGFKVIENAHLAVSEISVESVMRHDDLITHLGQNTNGAKERRILSDMSKMAAILNYKNGTQGFRVEDTQQLASDPSKSTVK